MIENTFLKRIREGRKPLVLSLKTPVPATIELAGRSGFDVIALDGQHGLVTPSVLDETVRVANALGMTVTARVPDIAYSTIGRVLDMGVQGITAPNISTAEQARALVDAAFYPPLGTRSFGGCRGTGFGDPRELEERGGKKGFMDWANANIHVVAQIETREGWENLAGILGVQGLMGIALGPNDLAGSLGHPGEPDHADVVAAIEDIQNRAKAAAKLARGNLSVTLDFDAFLLKALHDFADRHRNEPA